MQVTQQVGRIVPFPSKEHQFQPGKSGNPSGFSRKRRITATLLDLIEEKGLDRKLAQVWLKRALQGDHRFFHELLDRVEGPIGATDEQIDLEGLLRADAEYDEKYGLNDPDVQLTPDVPGNPDSTPEVPGRSEPIQ